MIFPPKFPWLYIFLIFIIGISFKCTVFIEPHLDGDEVVFKALVQQLEDGNGYTLKGHPLVEQGALPKDEYGHKLFFHPPGGVILFLVFRKIFGEYGYALVQLFSFALFYGSMIFLVRALIPDFRKNLILVVAALTAFNPVMSHVLSNYWLDGPLLAFTTFAACIFIQSVKQKSVLYACISGVLLGFASLIKLTAFITIPGLFCMALVISNDKDYRCLLKLCGVMLVVASVVQIPWEIWQWMVVGSPFPIGPGRAGLSSKTLVNTNRYIYYVAVIRSPWIYITLMPKIVCTVLPSILFFFIIKEKNARRLGLTLIFWFVLIVGIHIALGYLGYAKLMRYVILTTPASIILFSILASELICKLNQDSRKKYHIVMGIVCVLAFVLEIWQGMNASLQYHRALIKPLSLFL